MLYSILCYNSEAAVANWSPEKDRDVMTVHKGVMMRLAVEGKGGSSVRLLPTSTAKTVRAGRALMDGPFAETKEQLLGFYLVDCETLDEVVEIARQLTTDGGAMEIRPVMFHAPGGAVK